MVVSGSSTSSRSKTTPFVVWLLVGTGSLLLPGFLLVAFTSKLLPPLNYPLMAAIQKDRYYCYLVPLTLPALVVPISFHRLSMK